VEKGTLGESASESGGFEYWFVLFKFRILIADRISSAEIGRDNETAKRHWIERIGWIGANIRARREGDYFGGRAEMGESCRTEEKCKEKRMKFIKRFFFLPKSSRTLDRLSRREIDTEIFPSGTASKCICAFVESWQKRRHCHRETTFSRTSFFLQNCLFTVFLQIYIYFSTNVCKSFRSQTLWNKKYKKWSSMN